MELGGGKLCFSGAASAHTASSFKETYLYDINRGKCQ
jgi:hypothetical protein